MGKCGAEDTCLRCRRAYSNCKGHGTQFPCALYIVLVPIPAGPSSRSNQDWLFPALHPSPSSMIWEAGCVVPEALTAVIEQQSRNGRGSPGQTPTQETLRKGACLAALDQEIPAGRVPPPPCHPDPSPARHISDPCQERGRGVGGGGRGMHPAPPPLHAILAAACV